MIKKIMKESGGLAFTVAGTLLVLITLSGDTRSKGIWISGAALTVHLLAVVMSYIFPDESK
jgi:hypothetical protein